MSCAPVCIAGMHRSGTSMVARLLHLCGLNLGPADRLLAPAADNPEGFWEHLDFVALNEQLLHDHGGAWDAVPDFAASWETSPSLIGLREQARMLPAGFHEPWGWKDPRNSLTLPFWQNIWPDMCVVVCVRNPLAVAQSLLERQGFSFLKGLHLWLAHNRHLLAAAPPNRRVVTHYENYFQNPEGELRRVLGRLNLAASDDVVRAACATIKPDLRHSRITTEELTQLGVPTEIVDCYGQLAAEAAAAPRLATPDDEPVPRSHYRNAVRLSLELENRAELAVQQRRAELAHSHSEVAARDQMLADSRLRLEAAVAELDRQRTLLDTANSRLDRMEVDHRAAQIDLERTSQDLALARTALAATCRHADQFAGLSGLALKTARLVQTVRNHFPASARWLKRALRSPTRG